MIRFLPFILVPVLIIAGLGFWRFTATKKPVTPQVAESETSTVPVEVPKILPQATVEDRVKGLEDTMAKIVPQVNSLKSSGTQTPASGILDPRVASLESAVTDLKTRVAALEKNTQVALLSSTSSQPPIYIPIGSSAGPWTNTDWSTLNEYEISLDPASYPGYTGMVLEANFRVADPAGTGSVRLYNVTDASVLSSQLDTTSTSFKLYATSAFRLAGGQKTYKLQMKSSGGKDLYIQTARIKVSF